MVLRVNAVRIGIAAVAVASLAATAAAQQPGARQTASSVFDESHPGASTGLRLAIDYMNPSDPDAKSPAVAKVVLAFHPGTEIDTSAVARCGASDAALVTSGASACPAASRVGRGELDSDTGVPGPERVLKSNVTLLNNTGELILLLESKSQPSSRVVVRSEIKGNTTTTEAPPVPGGPPDGFTAVKRVRFALDRRPNYIVTPGRCPASGAWTNTATFTYRDGVTQTVTNRSSCTGAAARKDYKAPRIRLAGVPRRSCARGDFRARVRIAERWSGLRRARLSLGRRRLLVTSAKRFSRRIPARRLSTRRHRLTVVAVDRAGNRSVRRKSFRPCQRP